MILMIRIEKTVETRQAAIEIGKLIKHRLPELINSDAKIIFSIRNPEELDIRTADIPDE